ncbi:MAG: tetratricopeptide repeat protein [Cyclobacteriaceae bacterium]|nr:tetratricopeptide repeat protein [Cyclobacteriaceae bacterium]
MRTNLPIIFFLILSVCTSTVTFAQHPLSQGKIDRLFSKGAELIAHTNYGAARQVFTEFLKEASVYDSRRGEAEYYVAFSALNLGHSDGEKLIDHFITTYPSNPRATTAYFDLASFFYQEKNYSKAVSYFKKVNFPSLSTAQQSEGHFQWGYSYFNLKKLDEALEQFNFVKKQSNAYSPAANYYAGFIEYSKGQYEEATLDLKKAEGNSSYAAVVPYLLANVYYKQGKYDDLIQYGTSIKDRTGIANAPEISMLVAEAYYFKGDYQRAVDAYEKFLADNPDKGGSALLFRAGYANYMLKQDARAISYLSKSASSKDSSSYYASYYLGILYLKQGEKPLALNAFDFARKYPKDKRLTEESTFQFAKVSYDAGKPDQAISEFEKFLLAFPGSSHANEVKELLAQAYVNGNNYNKAIEYIEALPQRSTFIDQAYQKATYLKGTELFNKEDYPEAVQYFEKSLQFKKDPGFVALASFWAGEAYSIGRKFEEAVKHYQVVVSLLPAVDPEILVKTRYGLGYAHFNVQAYDKALFNFKDFANRGNKGTTNYADGLIRLADCYYVSKQYSDALLYYDRALTIGSPDNDYVLLQKAMISGIQGKYADARSNFTSLIQNYKKSQYRDEALYQRAQFEIEQGNYQAAVDGLTQLIQEGSNSRFLPYAFMRRAVSYFNLKRYDQTIKDYGTVVEQFQTHPVAQEALLPLQEALNIAGRSGEFEVYLAKFKTANPETKGLEPLEFETAKNLYFDQQYQKAIVSLKNFIASYPQSAKAQEANYYMAESYYRLRDYDKALPIYVNLSNDMSFSMGSRVVARVAEIEFKQGKFQRAVASFHRLEKLASNKKEQFNAWSGLMESFYFLTQYDSADVYARVILEKGNVNAGAQNKASLFLGKSALARGDYETAKDEFLNTLNTAQDEYGAEAKYLMGEIFYLKKEYKQCYETLISLNNDFASYEEWVGKSFLLLADNYMGMKDNFNAKVTLQSLIDKFPLQHIKDEARRKLNVIESGEVEKLQKIESDTVENNR